MRGSDHSLHVAFGIVDAGTDADLVVRAARAVEAMHRTLAERSVAAPLAAARLRACIDLLVAAVYDDGVPVVGAEAFGATEVLLRAARAGETVVSASAARALQGWYDVRELRVVERPGRPAFAVASLGAALEGAGGDVPTPLRLPLTGRASELAALRSVADRVEVGVGGCASLVGPPGSGRTRLAGELADELAAAGWRVVAAAGRACRAAGCDVVGGIAAAGAANDGGTLVVLDGADLTDPVINGVIEQTRDDAVLWLVIGAHDAASPFDADIVAVQPLAPEDLARLVDIALPGAWAPGEAARLAERMSGDVRCVEEVVRTLVDTGDVVQRRDGAWLRVGAVDLEARSMTAASLLGERLRLLSTAARDVLDGAAVLDEAFDTGALAVVMDRRDVDAAVAEIVGAGVVVEEPHGRWRLRSALVQQVIDDAMTDDRRARACTAPSPMIWSAGWTWARTSIAHGSPSTSRRAMPPSTRCRTCCTPS